MIEQMPEDVFNCIMTDFVFVNFLEKYASYFRLSLPPKTEE